ncbi:MAG: hypothetical protein ACLUR5_17590 [Eubacterium ventriosum]
MLKEWRAGDCSIEAGLIFTDLVIGLERIADHAVNIAYSILPEKKIGNAYGKNLYFRR